MGVKTVLALIGVIVCAFGLQSLVTRAMLMAKPSMVMPFSYISIVLGCIVDSFIFNFSLDFITIAGVLLASVGLLTKVFIGN